MKMDGRDGRASEGKIKIFSIEEYINFNEMLHFSSSAVVKCLTFVKLKRRIIVVCCFVVVE